MSAYKYLAFALGIPLVALFGAVLNEFVSPLITLTESQSSTTASATGIMWFDAVWTWMPLIVMLLLVVGLIVGVVNRRNAVGVR